MNNNWTTLIRQAFMPSHNFAGHPTEIHGAQELLAKAFEENIGYAQYCETIDKWIEENVPTFGDDKTLQNDYIATQKKRVRDLESFFMH